MTTQQRSSQGPQIDQLINPITGEPALTPQRWYKLTSQTVPWEKAYGEDPETTPRPDQNKPDPQPEAEPQAETEA